MIISLRLYFSIWLEWVHQPFSSILHQSHQLYYKVPDSIEIHKIFRMSSVFALGIYFLIKFDIVKKFAHAQCFFLYSCLFELYVLV